MEHRFILFLSRRQARVLYYLLCIFLPFKVARTIRRNLGGLLKK